MRNIYGYFGSKQAFDIYHELIAGGGRDVVPEPQTWNECLHIHMSFAADEDGPGLEKGVRDLVTGVKAAFGIVPVLISDRCPWSGHMDGRHIYYVRISDEAIEWIHNRSGIFFLCSIGKADKWPLEILS